LAGLNVSDTELTQLLTARAKKLSAKEFNDKTLVPVLKDIGLKKPTKAAVDAYLKKSVPQIYKNCSRCHAVLLLGQMHKATGAELW
jgi:hypothetical protein